jgi:hypothetical protein
MLSHEIERLSRRGRPAPFLDDQRYRWLWELFEGLSQRGCDAGRDHPRHGTTVRALLQLAQALHTTAADDRRSSLEMARAYIDDALAGRVPRLHLEELRESLLAKASGLGKQVRVNDAA